MSEYRETAFGLRPFEPYDHQAAAADLEQESIERPNWADDSARIVEWFECPRCDGHGARVITAADGSKSAELCRRCRGEGQLGATDDQVEAAHSIGSDNPFCSHHWNQSAGEADENGGRILCLSCGADGDA